ncbi:MAG: cyclomaltodextrinase [Lachnospiraceae bacterium]|nr:cyclomaltodextrinase [Lachnospiraceae bacterium]
MWYDESVFYQIYPLGFVGASYENDGIEVTRIGKVKDWIPHLQKLGANAVIFNPVFESDTHGYNARDYRKIDCRLGSNEDFADVCKALHKAGIKVVLDGVFNHAGRGFFAFRDVLEKRQGSEYRDWFYINFDGNDGYNDGLWYEGWEGNFDLVKLNLRNEAVVNYLLESVKYWIDTFDIDGLRLDVAYCVDRDFLKRLRSATSLWKEDFFLFGEMLHGDYKQIMNPEMCHSVTNYECYKGLYSSFNSYNLFEIVHSLKRQFGPEPWCLYTHMHLLNFVDNHDVTRVASILNDERNLPLIYCMLFTMPGIPAVYYGSEWGAKGDKSAGDPALRPCFDKPEWNGLTDKIAAMAKAKKESSALNYGNFTELVLQNKHCVFVRESTDERMLVAVNMDDNEVVAHFDAKAGRARDLISDDTVDFGGGLRIPGHTAYILQPY